MKELPAQEVKTQKMERIYGRQMMTKEEQAEYQAKMRAAKTPEERKQIRKEHHEKMKARAAERGVTLPDQPPAKGMGKGMGAATPGQATQEMTGGTRDRVYGSQLMTKEEQAEYRARRQAAKTPEEREKIRREHHEKMKARAAERGVTLPDEPPAPGMGKGMGAGGGGMGPGPAGR
jgi:1,2-phenylacetyl-CoA epoxidase catalytic subunit